MAQERWAADVVRAAALLAFVGIVFAVSTGRTRLEAWRTPIDYRGDTWAFLAGVKAARDGHVRPLQPILIPELNAPAGARWNDYPNRQPTLLFATGLLARAVGIFAAANLVLLLAHLLAAAAFYTAARYLRVRWEWAAAGASAFALAPYIFYRSITHLSLSLYWPIPLAILVVAECARPRGLTLGTRRFLLALAVALVVGLGNVYYAGLMAQFLLLAAAAQAFRRRWRLGLSPLLLAGVLVAAEVADNAHFFLARIREGPNPAAVVRPYGNLERFALKPIELVLPSPGASLAPWRALSTTYWKGALFRGEMGSAYLGLVGVLALLGLAFAALLRRRTACAHPTILAVLWIVLFSMVGGLNGFVGLTGFSWFRATNRYSIWILGLVLLAAAVRLSRRPWPRHVRALAAAATLALVLADQVPWTPAEPIADIRAMLRSDETLVRSIEVLLPAGAMIFMLPVVDYPEGSHVHRLVDYEHFRPYLLSSRLRFSYGTETGRPGSDWPHEIEALSVPDAVRRLEEMGFAGVMLNRRGYADGGTEQLEELRAAGPQERVEGADGNLVFVRLRPSVPGVTSPGG
ncbi:MAG: hypothetical protein ACHQKZ_09550 [Solirubrobacterales bacterium]|jgi:hypothetical protein